MQLTATQLAELIGGTVHGDTNATVSTTAPLHQAGQDTLTYATHDLGLESLAETNAGIAIVREQDVAVATELNAGLTIIGVSDDVETAFLNAAVALEPPRQRPTPGISPAAHISPTATLGEDVQVHAGATISDDACIGDGCEIYPGVYIGRGVTLGRNVRLQPNVVIYDDVSIGNNCTLGAGTIIGDDGFGYNTVNGRHVRIPHLGTVRIEDDVEIGANTAIDRAKTGATVIGTGTKMDNLVMIAHNCELGQHNLLVSQVGFAGSVTTGDYVVCAGQVGIADHVHLGTGAIFAAKCGVHRSLPGGQTYMGTPASPVADARKQLMTIRKLPDMRTKLRALEREVSELKASLEANSANSSNDTSPADAQDKAA